MTACPHCGKPIAESEAIQGLCPECLIKAGFVTGASIDGPRRPPYVPPTPEELARYFPQLEIIEPLGHGGMGAVYKARQKQLDRLVAVKILPPHISSDPSFAERFAREAKALAKLNHANIVTLYEFGQADGLFYFLMEYVDGVNLRQLLDAGRLSAREALAIVPQICDALQYAHDQGIVHRDIKPENILMDRRGRVKVADFGLAKLAGGRASELREETPNFQASGATDAGKVMGTPQYMAPEQIEHPSEVDHRADIYSLGVVFYQMLTGELPKGDITPPSKKVIIDVRLDEVVLRAMEKRPELRYQQVSDVKTMVEGIVTTLPGSASVSAPAGRRVEKPPRMADAVALILGIRAFTSPLACNLANASALGFLACLAFLDSLPGMAWCRPLAGFAGFFGLIGVACLVEMVARRNARRANTGAAVPPPGATADRMRESRVLAVCLVIIMLLISGGLLTTALVHNTVKHTATTQPTGMPSGSSSEGVSSLVAPSQRNPGGAGTSDAASKAAAEEKMNTAIAEIRKAFGYLPTDPKSTDPIDHMLLEKYRGPEGQAGELVNQTPAVRGPRLQFRLVAEAGDTAPADTLADLGSKERLRVRQEILLDESAIAGASVTTSPDNKASVTFELNAPGAKRLAEITGANIGRRLAVVLDGKLLAAPTIRAVIHDKAVITGNFTAGEVGDLVAKALSQPGHEANRIRESDADSAKPRLQFRIVADAGDTAPADMLTDSGSKEQLRVRREVLLDENAVASAIVADAPAGGGAQVELTFAEAGAKRFAEITGANVGKRLAMVFDGKLLSAPTIRAAIHDKAVITGKFTPAEAEALAKALNRPKP